MAKTLPIAVAGASGRMGQMLIRAIEDNPATHLSGVSERTGHDWIGRDLGACLGGAESGIIVQSDPREAYRGAGALLDFTRPDVSVENAKAAGSLGYVHVIGTTGFEQVHLDAIKAAASDAVIVRAGNMSLGVNLLTALTRKVAAALDSEYDIEVVEMHHKHKVDAPSGTALMLGEAAAEGRGVALDGVRDSGRDGITGARNEGDIGFSAIRGGDVIGEHDVIFAGDGERLVLRHIATDRQLFARGAVKAALWGQDRPGGEYSMMDVLGL